MSPPPIAEPEFVGLWDGEEVDKGQPTPRHEALRAELISQLNPQKPAGTAVVVTSIAGDEQGFARSDGSVVEVAGGVTPVWVEVLSEADLRRGDARLVGARRRRWLFEHDVLSLWAVTDLFGVVTLTVFQANGTLSWWAPPQMAEVAVTAPGGELRFAVDLGLLQAAADVAGDE